MNPEKIVVITPLLAAPNPRDFDDLIPLAAREVLSALEKQYSDIIASCGNNDNNSRDHILASNLRLSPIPCLENSDQWSDLQITIDTGSRRNQKLIDQSNRNLDIVLGNVQQNVDDLDLNKTSNNNGNSNSKKEVQIEKLNLKQFEFTEKNKKSKSKVSNDETNLQNAEIVTAEVEESVVTNNNSESEVQKSVSVAKSDKVTSRKISLEQFAFKPRPKNADESNSSDPVLENQVTINQNVENGHGQVTIARNSEITFNYVPSDDSSNMSFSQKSIEVNLARKTQNIVVDETPQCQQVSALDLLAQKYNNHTGLMHINNQIIIEETPQNPKSALELLAEKYKENGKQFDNSMQQRENNRKDVKIIVDETPQLEKSDLELLAQENENRYIYGDYTLIIENPNKHAKNSVEQNIIIDETPVCQQQSALERFAQKYNQNNCTKQTNTEQDNISSSKNTKEKVNNNRQDVNKVNLIANGETSSKNTKENVVINNNKHCEKVNLTANREIINEYEPSDDSSNMSLSPKNPHNIIVDETQNQNQASALESLSRKFNESRSKFAQNPIQNNPQIINKVRCNGNVDKILQNNQNTEFQKLEEDIIDETPQKQMFALELLAQKYNDSGSVKYTQNSQNPILKNKEKQIISENPPNTQMSDLESGKSKTNIKENVSNIDEQNIIDETPQCKNISPLDLLVKKYNTNLCNNFAQNAEIQNLINIKQSIKENVKDCKKPNVNYDKNIAKNVNFEGNFKNNFEQNIIDETPQNKHCILDILARKYKTNLKVDNLPSTKNQNNAKKMTQEISEQCEEDVDDLLYKSISQNKIRINKEPIQMEKQTENNIIDEKKLEEITQNCLNQSFTQNKIDYIVNWIMNLPDRDFKDTNDEKYDEFMDIDIPVDKVSDTNGKLQRESVENTNSTNTLNPCPNKENNIQYLDKIDLKNATPNDKNPNNSTQKQSLNLESGTQYVEDWFKDMPEEYSKIKNLFDFDLPASKAPKPTATFEIKPNPFLPPEPPGKPRKTKIIQRKTYMLEIDKSKPVPQPKRVQTKITSIFQPLNSDIPKENKQSNAKEVENKIIDNTKSRKRKISDHFKVAKAKSAKLDDQEEGHQGPKFVKKKYKYFTPIWSQLPKKEVKYEMYTVDDKMAWQMEDYIKGNVPREICFNIIYSNGFCQLSAPKKPANIIYNPNGLMLNISWQTEKLTKSYFTEFYHINLSKSYWKDFNVPRSLIKTCLTMNCRKVSFKAQTLFVSLMERFAFTAEEVSLQWIVLDPFIGCWVLDPDHPPTTFQGVQSQLDARPKYKVTATDVLIKACDMLIQLSETTLKLQSRLEERDLWTIFMEMEMKIVSILSVMEHRGISTNENILKSFSKTLKEKSETVEKKAYQIAGRKFQLNSPAQVRSILYDDLKLDTTNSIEIKQTATLGAKSTSEPMLQLLRKVHPLPGLVLEYRHLNKAKSTFVDAMLQHVKDGIIKSTWDQTAAATGRIASSNPNLQAIPKHPFSLSLFPDNGDKIEEDAVRLRNAYSARPGYTLLAADFQHIELRVFAHLARDQSITDALNSSGDIFMKMTKSWLGNKVDVITEEHREQTKKIVYATIYGAGPGKLADILCVSQEEAVTILRDFTNKFPSLREFSTATIEQCRIQGYLTSLSGRCRLFPNINSTVFGLKAQSERQAVNFLIQGSAADICKAAMISTEEKLKKYNCKLLLQIHDELVWEVVDSEVDSVKSIVKEVMEDTNTMCGKLIKLSVPLPVSISIGKNWGDMK